MLLALAVIAVASSGVVAQQRGPTNVWLELGLGGGAGGGVEAGLGFTAALAGTRGHHFAGLTTHLMADVSGFPDGGGDSGVGDLLFSYGRTYGGRADRGSWSVGPALTWFSDCPGGTPVGAPLDQFGRSDPQCYTLGLGARGGASLRAPIAGIGIEGFVNLNPKSLFAGVLLVVQLGWLGGS